MLNYGEKRDYRKIDIFVSGRYVSSTTWAKTCKQAEDIYKARHKVTLPVKAYFAK